MKQNSSILIVDDDPAIITCLSEILKQAGHGVAFAADGFKALAACKMRIPDLIILDLYMPLMSGSDVFKRLRTEERTRNIPVLFIKCKEDPVPQLDRQTLDEYPLLIKPCDPAELLGVVKTALREKHLKDELRKREAQIKELGLSDGLTSLRNMRYLSEFLKAELSQCHRYKTPLGLLVLEPDQTKEIQKAHGQKGIDSMLLQLAVVLTRGNRSSDQVVRSGPLEFAVVLPHTEQPGSTEVAQRLAKAVAKATFTVGDATTALTVSVGICQFTPDMDVDGSKLLTQARSALAQAKALGGNMVFPLK